MQVKARMSACRSTLQEAARWHQVVREANAALANGELSLVRCSTLHLSLPLCRVVCVVVCSLV